jgi:hypothetical protein
MALIIPPRWKRTADLIAEWQRPLREGDGLPLADIEAAERRLGFRLPEALREWYLLAGRRFYHAERRRDFYNLFLPSWPMYDYCAFCTDGMSLFGFHRRFSEEDPKVYIATHLPIFVGAENRWEKIYSFSTQAVYTFTLIYITNNLDNYAWGSSDFLKKSDYALNFKKISCESHLPLFEFYSNGLALVEAADRNQIRIAAKTEEALRAAMELFADRAVQWHSIVFASNT